MGYNTRALLGTRARHLRLGIQAGHFSKHQLPASPIAAELLNPNLSLLEIAHFPSSSPASAAWRNTTAIQAKYISGIPWNIATGHASLSNVVIEKTKTPGASLGRGSVQKMSSAKKEVRIGKGTQDGACLCAGLDSWGTTFGDLFERECRSSISSQSLGLAVNEGT